METGISYFGSRLTDHVFSDLERIKAAGCTYVVHTLSEEDLNFNLKNMAEIVAKTREMGMKAHIDPWGIAGIFGGETFSYFVATKLRARQVISDGRLGALACLNHPELRNFMKKWIDAAIDIGADTIFWDEPHFYVPGWFGAKEPVNIWGCKCEACEYLYKQEYGENMPEEETDSVKEFKHKCLVNFMTEMCAYSAKKGIENTLCMLPNEQIRDSGFWEEMAQIPFLHGFGTDPYWINRKKSEMNFDMEKYIRSFCRKVKSVSRLNNLRGHIWIQNFSIPVGWEKDIETAVDIAVSEEIEDIAAWSYYGSKGMSVLRSDRPEVVWQTLRSAYLKLHKK